MKPQLTEGADDRFAFASHDPGSDTAEERAIHLIACQRATSP